jgi:hypothetical protein
MKSIEKMSLFELNNFLNILYKQKERLTNSFAKYGVHIIDENEIDENQKNILEKHKLLQDLIENVELLIETKIFSGYVKKD